MILEEFNDQIIGEVVTEILSKTLEVRKLAVLETEIKQGNFEIFRRKASEVVGCNLGLAVPGYEKYNLGLKSPRL